MVVYTQQGPLKVSSRSCRVIEDYSVASVMVVLYRHRAPKLSQQLVSLVQYKRATHLLQRGDVFVFSDGTPWHSWQLLGLFLGHKRWQTHAPRAPHAPGAPHAPRAPQAPRAPHAPTTPDAPKAPAHTSGEPARTAIRRMGFLKPVLADCCVHLRLSTP